MEQSGGQFVEQTTHIFDLARYLAGDVAEVYANAAVRLLGEVESFNVTDVGAANLKFAGGAIGTIHNTCLLKMGWQTELVVFTPDGQAGTRSTLGRAICKAGCVLSFAVVYLQ
jgi:myo-inositol 2-dehydrogenase / D-chiro-inositol 1-dehydrogenase